MTDSIILFKTISLLHKAVSNSSVKLFFFFFFFVVIVWSGQKDSVDGRQNTPGSRVTARTPYPRHRTRCTTHWPKHPRQAASVRIRRLHFVDSTLCSGLSTANGQIELVTRTVSHRQNAYHECSFTWGTAYKLPWLLRRNVFNTRRYLYCHLIQAYWTPSSMS